MAIMPKLKPGDLVEYVPDPNFLGLVQKAIPARRRGDPVIIKLRWCGIPPPKTESDYVDQKKLRLVKSKKEKDH
jgi:hypothetical protein